MMKYEHIYYQMLVNTFVLISFPNQFKNMLTLEPWFSPVVLGGVPILRTLPNQEEIIYSVLWIQFMDPAQYFPHPTKIPF